MPRNRLRPFLDEVISDAELRSSAARVAADGDDPLVVSSPTAAGFPPPPWEQPPVLDAPPANGGEATIGDGAQAVPPDLALEPASTPPATPAVATANDLPAAVSAPGPDAPAADPEPDTDTVLLGTAAGEPAQPARRRRRSASLLPPLPSATDVPEDAPGRVAILSVPAPPQATTNGSSAHAATRDVPVDPAPIVAAGGEAPLAGWLPVVVLGVALVIVFVIGVLVTR